MVEEPNGIVIPGLARVVPAISLVAGERRPRLTSATGNAHSIAIRIMSISTSKSNVILRLREEQSIGAKHFRWRS